MKDIYMRFGRKFAAGHSVYISLGCHATEIDVRGSFFRLLKFERNGCGDELRHDVCKALGADTTFLASNEDAPYDQEVE